MKNLPDLTKRNPQMITRLAEPTCPFQFVKIEKESVAVKIKLEISQKRTFGFQNLDIASLKAV